MYNNIIYKSSKQRISMIIAKVLLTPGLGAGAGGGGGLAMGFGGFCGHANI